MQIETSKISKKYALAFLNVFFDQITNKCIEKLEKVGEFLKGNRFFFIYLRIPGIPISKKHDFLNKFTQSCDLCPAIKKIIFLILEHGRIELLIEVFDKIINLYRQKNNIQLFKISTSHASTTHEKEKVIKFVESLASGKIISKFIENKKLIAGMRIQSDTFLWERSVAKQLRDVKRSIFKQVELW